MKKMIFFSMLFMTLLSQAAELNVHVGPNPAYILPVSTLSCAGNQTGTYPEDNLAAPTFGLTTFKYQWTGDHSGFQFAYIQIELQSPYLTGGSYQCFISGDELDAVLGSKLTIEAGDHAVKLSACGLRCGGLRISDYNKPHLLQGRVKVVGTEFDAKGNASPLVSEAPVSLQYSPL